MRGRSEVFDGSEPVAKGSGAEKYAGVASLEVAIMVYDIVGAVSAGEFSPGGERPAP